ncbi:MAG: ATP-binding protein [Chitinophagaceae bacterium]|nr:ATP-binding protein [Chitinophagaceae bacterium]
MSETLENWQVKNDQYLAAAVEWLRLTLSRSERKPSMDWKVKDSDPVSSLPALAFIKERFGLSDFEHDILLLCVGMELDTRIAGLCAKAHEDPGKPYPTFSLAMTLFDSPAWDVLAAHRPLRYWKLIEINRLANQPLVSCPLRADERITNFIKGLNYLDERITKISSPFETPMDEEGLFPGSQQRVVDTIVKDVRAIADGPFPGITQLVGQDLLSKQLVAQKAAAALGCHPINLPFELFPVHAQETEEFARLWQRESMLIPIAGFIEAHKSDPFNKSNTGGQDAGLSLHRLISISRGIFFLSLRELAPDLAYFSSVVEVKKPTAVEQRAEWDRHLTAGANGTSALLAGQFDLNIPTIRKVVKRSAPDEKDNGSGFYRQLWDNCLSVTSPGMDALVQKLVLKATWNDIVLPEMAEKQLRQIVSQVRYRSLVYDSWGYRDKLNRGLGINALFVGESGTGKTMAAEVLANELSLNLYRIDLSGVVSKYIGETEKNLRRVFDAAEDGGAILFFDEADALFGKRSEVKDSHDRYANIEINYLLQRMEAYNGLAILATNKKSALDDAFVRRLRFIVQFPFPGFRERRMIAQKVFPPSVPRGELDYDRLASLNLTGGSFHNVAINAAFKAAEEGGKVTMSMILSAAKAEFSKMERPIKEADFIWNE